MKDRYKIAWILIALAAVSLALEVFVGFNDVGGEFVLIFSLASVIFSVSAIIRAFVKGKDERENE